MIVGKSVDTTTCRFKVPVPFFSNISEKVGGSIRMEVRSRVWDPKSENDREVWVGLLETVMRDVNFRRKNC